MKIITQLLLFKNKIFRHFMDLDSNACGVIIDNLLLRQVILQKRNKDQL